METDLTFDDALQPVLQALMQLEPLIYAANDGASRAHFEALLAPDFWEIGASGRRYGREFVLGVLEERQRQPRHEPWSTSDPHVRPLGAGHFLLTYTLHQPTRVSRRATVWRQAETGWQMVYHQGTVVEPETSPFPQFPGSGPCQ